jgi:EmrB/QacA subfamily drug resistance transporter
MNTQQQNINVTPTFIIKHRTTITIATCILILMELFDATILNTALPVIAASLSVPMLNLKTSITGYLVVLAILTPISGYIADKYGIKRCLNYAILLFLLGSILCSIANTATALSVSRIIQGAGAAMMTPVGRILFIKMYTPQELTKIMPKTALVIMVGPILAPICGGIITTYFTWHWIFLINIPIGIITLYLINSYLPNNIIAPVAKFNYIGFILIGITFATINFGLDVYSDGTFSHQLIYILFILGICSGISYVLYHKRGHDLFIDLKLLKINLFRSCIINTTFGMCATSAIGLIIPIILQGQLHLTPLQSGLLTFPMAIGALIIRPILSVVYKHVSLENLLIISTLTTSLTLIAFIFLDAQSSILALICIELIYGMSYGALLSTNAISAFNQIEPHQKTKAVSFHSSMHLFAMSLGVGIGSTVFMNLLLFHHAQLGNINDYTLVFTALHECVIILGAISFIAVIWQLLIKISVRNT